MDIHIHCHVHSFSGAYLSFCDVIPSPKKQDPLLVCNRCCTIYGWTGVVRFVRLFFWCDLTRHALNAWRICYFLYCRKWLVIESGKTLSTAFGVGRSASFGLDSNGIVPQQIAAITPGDVGYASTFYREANALAQSNQ